MASATTAPLTPQIVERLIKFILLLASPHDGEKIAACGAIMRTLSAAGLDLHALADVLKRAGDRPPPDPPHDGESPQAAALWCLRAGGAGLSAKERRFLEDIAEAHYALSERQSAWLDAIVARLRAGAR